MESPGARGPASGYLLEHLKEAPHLLEPPLPDDGALGGEDFHLALFLCYELAYGPAWEWHPRWEWEPSLIGFRRDLEDRFEKELRSRIGPVGNSTGVAADLIQLAGDDSGPSLAGHLQVAATAEQVKEFLIHRSAYHLMEADPHTWAIPRLRGRAKAAMVEIQADEYGGGDATRMHSSLFADAMRAVGLVPDRAHYVDQIPGITLSTVNLMSMFGLNRRLRGAAVGHLALFEMTSTSPNRKYGYALRRLGLDEATEFFDEHVEADAVHEQIAAYDLAGALAEDEPELAGDIFFGARALQLLDQMWARHVLSAWEDGNSSLRKDPVSA